MRAGVIATMINFENVSVMFGGKDLCGNQHSKLYFLAGVIATIINFGNVSVMFGGKD